MSREVVNLFNNYKRRFGPQQGADARECKALQKNLWRTAGQIASSELSKSHSNFSTGSELQNIIDWLLEIIHTLASVDEDLNGDFIVNSRIPLLDKDTNYDLIIRRNKEMFVGAVLAEACPFVCVNQGSSSNIDKFYIVNSFEFRIWMTRYVSLKQFEEGDFENRLKKFNRSAAKVLDEVSQNAENYKNATVSINTDAERILSSFEAEKQKKLEMMQASATAQIEARLNAQKELDRIKYPVELWAIAAKRHHRRFWYGITFLFSIVATCVFLMPLYIDVASKRLDFVKSDMTQPFTPATTFTLAIIIALIAASGYLLKIIGRFVTNSLTLTEDAEVRAALADTFIGLTAEDSSLSKEARDQARTVMLAALFRPLPGHQQEDITAPTVLSLAQDLLKKPNS